MIRNTAAVIAGIVAAFLTIMLVDMLGHVFYPPPLGLDFSDAEAIRPYLANLPLGSFLFIMASSIAGGFFGILVACAIGTVKPAAFAVVIGGIVLAASTANFILIPHPLWLSLVTLVGIVASAWLAMVLATKLRG